MKRVGVQKSGWNTHAALFGPFWYFYRGMAGKGLVLLLISLVTLGIGIIPVWIYCGCNGNKDLYKYIKNRGMYIFK